MTGSQNFVKFIPSQVEGLPDVDEVIVHPDRLEVMSAGRWLKFPFASIARPQESGAKSFLKRVFQIRTWPPMIGERNWCFPPEQRFFMWYTDPPLKTFMPETEGAEYGNSLFPRIHDVLAMGGYATFDLA